MEQELNRVIETLEYDPEEGFADDFIGELMTEEECFEMMHGADIFKSRLQPDFFEENKGKFATLMDVGIKLAGGEDLKDVPRVGHGKDFSFLAGVTFVSGSYGIIGSFDIPFQPEENLTISMVDTMTASKALPYVSPTILGTSGVCFRAVFESSVQSFFWVGKNIFRVNSSHTFWARVVDQTIHVLGCKVKGFKFENDRGYKCVQTEWEPYSHVTTAKYLDGIDFFFEDKVYSCKRDFFFPVLIEEGKMYTRDRSVFCTTSITVNGVYDVSIGRFLERKSCYDEIGTFTGQEKFYTRGRFAYKVEPVSLDEFTKMLSGLFKFAHFRTVNFKSDARLDHYPYPDVFFLNVYKSGSFNPTYYNTGRDRENYMKQISYGEYKNHIRNSRIKHGHGYNKEKRDGTGPTVTHFVAFLKRRLAKYYVVNDDTGDIMVLTERMPVSDFYTQLTMRGFYWKQLSFFLLSPARAMYYLGINLVDTRCLIFTLKKDEEQDLLVYYKNIFFVYGRKMCRLRCLTRYILKDEYGEHLSTNLMQNDVFFKELDMIRGFNGKPKPSDFTEDEIDILREISGGAVPVQTSNRLSQLEF
jgi:hypothetical protein